MHLAEFPFLHRLGWNSRLARDWATAARAHARPARVLTVARELLTIDAGDGPRTAFAAGTLLREDPPATGDWVAWDAAASRADARLPGYGELARRDRTGARQVLARNVDTALLVMGLDGDWSPRRLERYLALTRHAGVTAVVVASKADAHDDADARVAALARRVGAATPVFALDGRAAAAAAVLAPWLAAGQTVVLLGSSGAGKSTLLNTLMGAEIAATGAVRAGDDRGRHTTTARELRPLPQGACVIDTPGLRGLQLDLEAAEIPGLFADVAALARRCRFRDCRHADEPGCAVREAVDPDRLQNLHKLEREAMRLNDDQWARQARKSLTKAAHKALRAKLKDKGRK